MIYDGESRMIVPPSVSDIQSKSYIHNQLVDVAVILEVLDALIKFFLE
jgi:hypothetical protein